MNTMNCTLLLTSVTVIRFVLGSFDVRVLPSRGTSGPIALAAAREATRLADATEPTSPDSKTVPESARPAPGFDWSRVRALAAGTEIIVTVKGSEPRNRHVVTVNDSELTVLNVTDPTLPAASTSVLRVVAARRPEVLAAAQRGETFLMEKNVRIAQEGVFVADRKVAALTQVVERIGRHDVTEISIAKRDANAFGCAAAAYVGGGVLGGLPGAVVGGAVNRDTGGALLGMMIGWPVGATVVYRKCRHKPEHLVYRAPPDHAFDVR